MPWLLILQTKDLVEAIVADIGWITHPVQFCCCNHISECNCAEADKVTNTLSPVYWYSWLAFISSQVRVDEVEGEEEVKRKLKEYYAENEQRWKDRSLTGKHRII